MFKCDKCGCEHTSRTVCPKCGAPVVIVNQDYLLRRQQWEEQQRNNLRYKKKGESEGASRRTSQSAAGRSGADRKDGSDNFSSDKNSPGVAEKILELKNNLLSKIRDKKSVSDEERKKKEREKNAAELKDNRRERKIKERRRKIIMSAAAAAGIIVVAGGIFAGVKIYKGIDRSDVRYFDGHELLSVNDGLLLAMDREDADYALLTYTSGLNAALLGGTRAGGAESLLGWYDGEVTEVVSDIGDITDEYIFSESGRYLAYVLYSEEDERYFLVIYDLSDGGSNVYDTDRRVQLVAVNNGGEVFFNELDTGDYSTVVGMNFYMADLNKKILIAENVRDAGYDESADRAVFMQEDRLYVCDVSKSVVDKYDDIISDKEHIFVNEGVISIVDNVLKKSVLYMTDAGLWIYSDGYNVLAAASVDASDEFYYDGDQNLYHRTKDKLYYVKQSIAAGGKKSKSDANDGAAANQQQEDLDTMSAQKAELVIDGISGDIVISDNGKLWCVTKEGLLFNSDSFGTAVDSGVTDCTRLLGADGCAYVKDGQLVACFGDKGKNKILLGDMRSDESTDFNVISSKKYLYYVDSSSVLWKIAKNGKERESLGFVSLTAFYSD